MSRSGEQSGCTALSRLQACQLPPAVGLPTYLLDFLLPGRTEEEEGSWCPLFPHGSSRYRVGSVCGPILGLVIFNIWWSKYQGTDNTLLYLGKGRGDLMAGVDQGSRSSPQQSLLLCLALGYPQPQSQGAEWSSGWRVSLEGSNK